LGTAAAVCALAAVPAAAQVQEQGAYFGADVAIVSSVLEYRLVSGGSPVQESYQTAHLRLRGGYRITRMFAIEAQFLNGSDDTQPDPFANSFRMSTGPIAGLFGRVDFPLGQQAGLYGLLGIASVETEYQAISLGGAADKEKSRKLAFGAGVDMILAPHVRASADLTFYRHGNADYPTYFPGESPDHTVTALGFGLSYLF
jgi:opacity protein-like surface antigen